MTDATAAHPAPPHAHLPIDLRWWKQAAGVVVAVPVALYLAYGTTLCAWRAMVTPPAPTHLTLANGVEYTREVERDPNRVWHIVKVDLMAEGLKVQGPEADASLALPLHAMPATEAVAKNGWVIGFGAGESMAANAGEPTTATYGAISRGVAIGTPVESRPGRTYLSFFSNSMHADLGQHSPAAISEVRAEADLLTNGQVLEGLEIDHPGTSMTRLGIGINATGKTMYIASIDGRLAKSSKGATAKELAEKLKSLGAVNAAQFAHGDEVGMAAVLPGTTEPSVLGTPTACGIPGREPALGYMLGIKASPRF